MKRKNKKRRNSKVKAKNNIPDSDQQDQPNARPSFSIHKLEPRILLSGDVLLCAAAHYPIVDRSQQILQYAELLQTNEQIPAAGQELSREPVPTYLLETDLYQPIITLHVNTDGNVNEVSGDLNMCDANLVL